MKKLISIYILIITSGFLLSFYFEKDNPEKFWIFFDKKDSALELLNRNEYDQLKIISKKALERRKKVKPAEALLEETDLPINKSYIVQLERIGVEIQNKSRWLNGVTANLTKKQINELKLMNFIKKIEPVHRYKRKKPDIRNINHYLPKSLEPAENVYDYGLCYDQIRMHDIDKIHNLGITGKGVLVGFLDSGFRINHEALYNTKVKAEYDFIFDDEITDNESNDTPGAVNHGTYTLSNVAAFKEGSLIGVAFDAEFALAKTEDVRWELPVEEDDWIAGIEWLESIGCDVVNSSLGYTDFDDGTSYSTSDLDGQTMKTTIAADIAVNKGVVVVNSAGNERQNSWGTLVSPADGFNVIAVGAVSYSGNLFSYSSPGPTADGRIKPDVCAKSGNVSASPEGYDTYSYVGGTSLSAPIVAGAAALLLSAKPSMTPEQVTDALKSTASKSDNPDNDFGWGIINAYNALFKDGIIFIPDYSLEKDGNNYLIKLKVVSSQEIDENNVFCYFSTDSINFSPVTMNAPQDSNLFTGIVPVYTTGQKIYIYFAVKNNTSGQTEYFPDINRNQFLFLNYGDTVLSANEKIKTIPEDFDLKQNYPNPFNNQTKIEFDLPGKSRVKLEIFNILGQKVKTIINKQITPGKHVLIWHGENDYGNSVSSGIYIYRISTGKYVKSKKMMLIK